MAEPALTDMLSAIVAATPELAAVVDANLRPVFLNPASAVQPFPHDPVASLHPTDRDTVQDAVSYVLREATATSVLARIGDPGRWQQAIVRLAPLESGEAAVMYVVDPETCRAPEFFGGGLPDRPALMRYVDQLAADGRVAWLLICGVDRFRLVSESLGHEAGDEALDQIEQRLAAAVHDGDVLARLGGDRFAVVCAHERPAPSELAAELQRAVREPMQVRDSELVLTVSIGMAPTAVGLTSLDTLVGADAALFLAKERGRDRVELFDQGMRDVAVSTLKRTSELRQAAARHQLVLYFQPIVELATDRVIGCEGLLRWQHPEEGLLTPSSFIGLVESSGLMGELTPVLLGQAAGAGQFLDGAVAPNAFVSVNISASQLGDPNLVRMVERALEAARLPPDRLVVELTETAVLHDLGSALRTLTRLRDMGVGVALDDFGIGYSSLLYLRRLPVTKLKLDRSFVNGCLHSQDDLAIVASVIDLSARMGVDCIAEGVESKEQARLLTDLGCRAGQGYLWGPAVPMEQLSAGLAAGVHVSRSATETPPDMDVETQGLIMAMHRQGASLRTIAAALNEQGRRTSAGRKWRSQSVALVVAHTAYPDLRNLNAES